MLLTVCRRIIACFLTLACTLPAAELAKAQGVEIQGFEVTPFIGGRFGGTFEIQPEGGPEGRASLGDAVSFGVSAGVRFDDLSLIEFRYTRAKPALQFEAGINPLPAPPGDVTLDQFHGDFTREFSLEQVNGLRPFLMASVGATHLGTASNGFTRFSFGLGTGLKLFLNSRVGFRAEARWLPIWVQPEVRGFACGGGGCLVVLSGRLVQQFEVSVGPVFHF